MVEAGGVQQLWLRWPRLPLPALPTEARQDASEPEQATYCPSPPRPL
jgi:hypothetical protein